MIYKIYTKLLRPLFTKKGEQSYSGGFWPRLAREKQASMASALQGKVVELGCGEGLFIKDLLAVNPTLDIYGLDFNAQRVQQAQQAFAGHDNVHISLADAQSTSLPDHSIDSCFCVNTILNIPTDTEILTLFNEAHRLIKKGGLFIFDYRNSYSPIIRLQYGLVRFYDTAITVPVRHHTMATITRLLTQAHFTVKTVQHVGIPQNSMSPVVIVTAEAH